MIDGTERNPMAYAMEKSLEDERSQYRPTDLVNSALQRVVEKENENDD